MKIRYWLLVKGKRLKNKGCWFGVRPFRATLMCKMGAKLLKFHMGVEREPLNPEL
jgi:hypothetical protein